MNVINNATKVIKKSQNRLYFWILIYFCPNLAEILPCREGNQIPCRVESPLAQSPPEQTTDRNGPNHGRSSPRTPGFGSEILS